MGIQIEFNPDLALRDISYYHSGKRTLEECIPETLEAGKEYDFLKEGQRNYWFQGEIPLLQIDGNQQLSRPLASIVIIEATHYLEKGKVYTCGVYRVEKVLDPESSEVYFEGMNVNPNYKIG